MNDWAADYVINYIENGVQYHTIWAGLSREDAIREFKEAYPERTVIEGDTWLDTTLTDVESALVNASNLLHEIEGVKTADRYTALNDAIELALTLCQNWKAEVEG